MESRWRLMTRTTMRMKIERCNLERLVFPSDTPAAECFSAPFVLLVTPFPVSFRLFSLRTCVRFIILCLLASLSLSVTSLGSHGAVVPWLPAIQVTDGFHRLLSPTRLFLCISPLSSIGPLYTVFWSFSVLSCVSPGDPLSSISLHVSLLRSPCLIDDPPKRTHNFPTRAITFNPTVFQFPAF